MAVGEPAARMSVHATITPPVASGIARDEENQARLVTVRSVSSVVGHWAVAGLEDRIA